MLLTLYPLVFQQSSTAFVYLVGNQNTSYTGTLLADAQNSTLLNGSGIGITGGSLSISQSNSPTLSGNYSIAYNGILAPHISALISPTGNANNASSGVLGYSALSNNILIGNLSNVYQPTLQISTGIQGNAIGSQSAMQYGGIASTVSMISIPQQTGAYSSIGAVNIEYSFTTHITSAAIYTTSGNISSYVLNVTDLIGIYNETKGGIPSAYIVTSVVLDNTSIVAYTGYMSAYEFIRCIFSMVEYPSIAWVVIYRQPDMLQTDYVCNSYNKHERGIEWSKENHATLHLLREVEEV